MTSSSYLLLHMLSSFHKNCILKYDNCNYVYEIFWVILHSMVIIIGIPNEVNLSC